jgi:arylsulfatase A-like enzyme
VDRLSDHEHGDFFRFADSSWRRVLDPSVDEHRFAIAHAEPGAHLLVFPGIEQNSPAGRVLFEITWMVNAEPPVTIYRRELPGPGWSEADVELPSAGPGELRLYTTAAPESEAVLKHASWGDPTLVSGSLPARPSVILISLDTLRADRLGVYGRREARTPALDALARHGVWYTQAYSSSTWTRPSHQSLLFGIQPWALDATDISEASPTAWSFEGFESLADAFRRAGYLTGAFTGGGFVAARYGLAHGFDSYFEYAGGSNVPGKCDPARFDGAEVFGRAARWLRARAGVPFFLFIHTYESHDRCPVTPVRHKPFQGWGDSSVEERQSLVRYYDDVVARTDELVSDLLRELDSLGLADSTVVALTSDHGEGLWEHKFCGHGCNYPPYEELTHVPLIVRLPRSTRRIARIDASVSTIDLAPTLLALADVSIPRTMHGSMLPGLGLPADADRPVYVQCGSWLSVRKGDLTFLISPQNERRMLFNTQDDPQEQVDLVAHRSAAKDALRRLARQYWSLTRNREHPQAAAIPEPELDPATAERLRALGYAE